jgi:hypothetical protein
MTLIVTLLALPLVLLVRVLDRAVSRRARRQVQF